MISKLFFLLGMICFTGILTCKGQTNRIIIKLKKNNTCLNDKNCNQRTTGVQKVDSLSQKFNAIKVQKKSLGKKSGQFIYILQFPEGTDLQPIIDEYNKSGEVEYAEPDHKGSTGGTQGVSPNDQYYYRQWSLHNDGSFNLSAATPNADIDMENAWTIEQGSSTVVVGIIDTGFKLDHPEFSGRLWTNTNEIAGNAIDDDHNGYVDDVNGWDFANTDNDPSDDQGHGTNVTGIIGANGNNSIGYAGLDWNCKLMPLKGINSSDYGYYSWWADAIYYAVDNGAHVINMSVGGSSASTTLQDAVDYAVSHHVTIVACMMNTNSNTPYYPAACTGVIAVGSTDADDERSDPFFWSSTSGSNYGNHISVVAPGNYIYGLNYLSNTDYSTYWGGTSQATPHVTGLCALLLAQDPTRTPAQLKSIIEATAEDQVGDISEDIPGWDPYYGHGRINAYHALSQITTGTETTNEQNPMLFSPNPFSEQTLLTVNRRLKNARIAVVNTLGQTVFQVQNINEETFLLRRDHLPCGSYSVLIMEDNQPIQSQKIMVID